MIDFETLHLPDLATFDGVLELLSCCILAILGNVLDFRTYSAPNQDEDKAPSDTQKPLMKHYDRNNIPRNERMAICYARGVALSIFDWVRTQFVITGPSGNVVDDLPSLFLVQIGKSVVSYKAQAMRLGLKGAPHCSTAALRNQVANAVKCDYRIDDLWRSSQDVCNDSLVFKGDGYLVQRNTMTNKGVHPSRPFSASMTILLTYATAPPHHLQRGMTPFDTKFFQGEADLYSVDEVSWSKAEKARPSKKSRIA